MKEMDTVLNFDSHVVMLVCVIRCSKEPWLIVHFIAEVENFFYFPATFCEANLEESAHLNRGYF